MYCSVKKFYAKIELFKAVLLDVRYDAVSIGEQ